MHDQQQSMGLRSPVMSRAKIVQEQEVEKKIEKEKKIGETPG